MYMWSNMLHSYCTKSIKFNNIYKCLMLPDSAFQYKQCRSSKMGLTVFPIWPRLAFSFSCVRMASFMQTKLCDLHFWRILHQQKNFCLSKAYAVCTTAKVIPRQKWSPRSDGTDSMPYKTYCVIVLHTLLIKYKHLWRIILNARHWLMSVS